MIFFNTLHRNWPTCMTRCIVHTVKWRRSCTRARDCSAPTSEWLSLARLVRFSHINSTERTLIWSPVLQSNSHWAWELLKIFFSEHDHMQWPVTIHSNTLFCFLSSLKAAVSCAVASLSSLSLCVWCRCCCNPLHCVRQTCLLLQVTVTVTTAAFLFLELVLHGTLSLLHSFQCFCFCVTDVRL